MGGHGARGLELPAILQVGGDAGRPEAVVANGAADARGLGAPADHRPGGFARHRPVAKRPPLHPARHGTEQRSFTVAGDPRRLDIGIEITLEQVVAGHVVALAALLVQPQPHAPALGVVVANGHSQGRGDAREAVDQHADQCPVAQADHLIGRQAVEQIARFVRAENRGFPAGDAVLGPAHHGGRVGRQDLTDDQPVEQHAQGGELLLDGRHGVVPAEPLHPGGDVYRLDLAEPGDAALAHEAEKPAYRPRIGISRIGVGNLRGEEFEEPPLRPIAGGNDQRRQQDRVIGRDQFADIRTEGQVVHSSPLPAGVHQ